MREGKETEKWTIWTGIPSLDLKHLIFLKSLSLRRLNIYKFPPIGTESVSYLVEAQRWQSTFESSPLGILCMSTGETGVI